MIRLAHICLLALCLVALPLHIGLAASMRTEVLEPQHRLAETLIPVIEPMLDEGESVKAYQNKLIIRADDQTIGAVEQLLEKLDTQPALLRVMVRVGSLDHHERDEATGSVTARTGEGERPTGSARVEMTHTNREARDRVTKEVQVLEGREAFVQVGQRIPTPEHGRSSRLGRRAGGIAYEDVNARLAVRPRLLGEKVRLEVRVDDEALRGSGHIDTESVASTVTGALGQWLQVGGISDTTTASDDGVLHTRRERLARDRQIWIKVEKTAQDR